MAKTQATSEPLGAQPKSKYRWLVRLLVLGLIAGAAVGGYLLILTHAPGKSVLSPENQATFLEQQDYSGDKLIIPRLGVSESILSGDASVLDQGLWHRFPERGNPKESGNTIVAGHRYVFAVTPQKVIEQSRLYNLDKLGIGDAIYINWEGKRYEYKVTETKTVNPNDSAIEAPSMGDKLTLYTCTLDGQSDGRVVVVAKPTGDQ